MKIALRRASSGYTMGERTNGRKNLCGHFGEVRCLSQKLCGHFGEVRDVSAVPVLTQAVKKQFDTDMSKLDYT